MKYTTLLTSLILVVVIPTSYAQFLFQPSVTYSLTDQPTHLCAGDFNNDGKVDIATSNKYQNSVSVLLGDGTGLLNFSAQKKGGYSSRLFLSQSIRIYTYKSLLRDIP